MPPMLTFVPMPKKTPGLHRWICIVTYSLSQKQVEAADDPATPKYLDEENRTSAMIGCYDCEEQLGDIDVGSSCPAPAST